MSPMKRNLNQGDRELLLHAPDDWAMLGALARHIDHVRALQDAGYIKTRMMPDPEREGYAHMEWQVTGKGLKKREEDEGFQRSRE